MFYESNPPKFQFFGFSQKCNFHLLICKKTFSRLLCMQQQISFRISKRLFKIKFSHRYPTIPPVFLLEIVRIKERFYNISSIYIKQIFMLRKVFLGGFIGSSFYCQKSDKPQCCGIFGVVSSSPTIESRKNQTTQKSTAISVESLLSHGVELLKNRGYDSAGIISFAKTQNKVQRMLGKFAEEGDSSSSLNCIQKLVQKFTKQSINSTIGIAHTRWATCGQVNQRNCHPHYDQDEQIFLVHNGIINNHSEIRNKYLSDITFRSETDTEVVAQLMGKLKKQGHSIIECFKILEGYMNKDSKWGIVLIDKEDMNTMYTSTREQPILIGFSSKQTQIFVASQKIAFQQQADCYFQARDNQVWQLSVDRIKAIKDQLLQQGRLVMMQNNTEVLKEPPQPYERFFDYEIRRQGQIEFKPDFQKLSQINFGDYLSLIACGSSYYAAMSTVWYFKHLKCFKKINVYDPVDLQAGDITDNEAVVLISQSGETKDLINIIQECKKKKNVKTVGIINVEGSTLARKTDYPIYIKVGRQVSVAATKSFFHQVLNLIYYATLVAQRKQSADMALIKQIRKNLLDTPSVTKKCIEMVEHPCQELAKLIYKKESLYLLALRESLAIAREAALKLKELNYIHAQAMGACEMKHGPIALVASDKPQQTVVFLFVLDNDTFPLLMNTLDQMHSRKAFVVVITDCKNRMDEAFEQEAKKHNKKLQQIPRKYHFIIQIPNLPYVNHLMSVIPMQILVQKIAKLKHINPDMPRNLAKTVTV